MLDNKRPRVEVDVLRLIRTNPVASIDRARLAQPEMSVLTEVEIAGLRAVYDQLHQEAPESERPWWLLAKATRFESDYHPC